MIGLVCKRERMRKCDEREAEGISSFSLRGHERGVNRREHMLRVSGS